MPCLAANLAARARSRAATAVTRTPSTRRAGRISAGGAMRAAPRTPMRMPLRRGSPAVTGQIVSPRWLDRSIPRPHRVPVRQFLQRPLDGVDRGRLLERAVQVVDVHLEPAVERLELLDLAVLGDLLGLGRDVRLFAQ